MIEGAVFELFTMIEGGAYGTEKQRKQCYQTEEYLKAWIFF